MATYLGRLNLQMMIYAILLVYQFKQGFKHILAQVMSKYSWLKFHVFSFLTLRGMYFSSNLIETFNFLLNIVNKHLKSSIHGIFTPNR